MSIVELRGVAHTTTATAMVCGGILIEFVRLSGISVVCSCTSMITLQSSSIIFLEPCFVHTMRIQFRDVKSFPKIIGCVWLLQTMNFCVKERPLIAKEHSVNPIGSILIPVTVTMKGHLTVVSCSFKDSKVLRLMQLFVAPVSYKALILRPKLLIGKQYLLLALRLLCKYLQNACLCYVRLYSSHQICSALVVSPVSWGWGHPPGSSCRNTGTSPLLRQTLVLCSQSLWQIGP